MRYEKPHLTFEQQLALIEGRGLSVRDRDSALLALRTIGYYRLSGYWYPWRQTWPDESGDTIRLNVFTPGHAFEDAVSVASFDRELRLLILDGMERVEIALRVAVAYAVGKHGPLAYLERANLGSNADNTRAGEDVTNFDAFLARNEELLDRSRETFAEHIKVKYDCLAPIWIATELWDFGQLASFFSIMSPGDQTAVAQQLGISSKKPLSSWIQSLVYVRNLCAHHARLYRRILVVKPSPKHMSRFPGLAHIRDMNADQVSRLYPMLCVMVHLMRTVAPHSDWAHRVRWHLESFPVGNDLSLKHYGFPDDWLEQEIWNIVEVP